LPAAAAADSLPAAADSLPAAAAADSLPAAAAADSSDAAHDSDASLGALEELALAPPPPTGPERRREEAFDAAWRFLARRDRTETEIRVRLERNDVDPELVEEVLDSLKDGGYVDDAEYARRFAEDRRNLDGWGGERIERRLADLGIAREHIRAALASDDGHDELDAACELLARRFPRPPETPRELERALGFLVRKGYELELAHDALRRHGAAAL
jgi:regulatory protein